MEWNNLQADSLAFRLYVEWGDEWCGLCTTNAGKQVDAGHLVCNVLNG